MQPPQPKVLIIGDSISIGYFPFVKSALANKAEVYHNAGNAQSSTNGVAKIKTWLGDTRWDVIQFNWGLWDVAYRTPVEKGTGPLDKTNGKLTTTPKEYEQNIEKLIHELEKTGARLIFVNTTYVPKAEPGRNSSDVRKYNRIAEKMMKKHKIIINDLYTPSIGIHSQKGLGTDNVHYSTEGYEALSFYVTNVLERVISLKEL